MSSYRILNDDDMVLVNGGLGSTTQQYFIGQIAHFRDPSTGNMTQGSIQSAIRGKAGGWEYNCGGKTVKEEAILYVSIQ